MNDVLFFVQTKVGSDAWKIQGSSDPWETAKRRATRYLDSGNYDMIRIVGQTDLHVYVEGYKGTEQ